MRFAWILPFALLGCADETISGYADPLATYKFTELNGAPVNESATIKFPKMGHVEGEGPCNTWSATQSAPYPWIELGPIAATRRACPDLELETRFFSLLQETALAEVSGPVLVLTGEDIEMVFRAE